MIIKKAPQSTAITIKKVEINNNTSKQMITEKIFTKKDNIEEMSFEEKTDLSKKIKKKVI